MLSPRDVMLVESWRARGVPVRVALAAVEEGVARYRESRPPGAPLPSSLAYFAGHVEEAWAERRELLIEDGASAAAAEAPAASDERALDAVLAAVVSAGRGQGDEGAREVLRVAWRQLAHAPPDADPWALTARVDAEMVDALAATLSQEALAEVSERAHAAAERAGGATLSARARADLERAEFEQAVRARLRVPDLVEVLLEQTM
jgi:hypothetical protein